MHLFIFFNSFLFGSPRDLSPPPPPPPPSSSSWCWCPLVCVLRDGTRVVFPSLNPVNPRGVWHGRKGTSPTTTDDAWWDFSFRPRSTRRRATAAGRSPRRRSERKCYKPSRNCTWSCCVNPESAIQTPRSERPSWQEHDGDGPTGTRTTLLL